LSYLKTRGTTLVLGLREVMDAPHLLKAEWAKRDVLRKIGVFYDSIWVYGPADFYDPLAGFDVPQAIRSRMNYVGFLQRYLPHADVPVREIEGGYILATTGGGGDGADLIHNIFDAYRHDATLKHRVQVVLGPFMPARKRRKLIKKGSAIPGVEIIEFDNRMENLVAGASAVVGMGGYNTFCEILSFDKPALIVPRVTPREEQLIRARRAAELGVIDMLLPQEAEDPVLMSEALGRLPNRAPPSRVTSKLRLDGLENITDLVGEWLEPGSQKRLSVIEGGT
jgi:predicted glycosyltransferase